MGRRGNGTGAALLALAGVGIGLAAREALGRLREADLGGKVALVTGGSRGLGYLLARELAAESCRLVICARDEQELAWAHDDLERRGAEVLAVPCDVGDREQVERMVGEALRHFGQIDILVNNAGIIQVGPVQSMTEEDFRQAMQVMYWGVVYPTLAVLPSMLRRQRGLIVNITSIGGKVSVPHLLPYSAAKFAAVGFSEGLRAELMREGISVVTIAPGLMRTGSALNALFKGQQAKEFGLFGVLASLPILSMDAERAARRIVTAAKRGEAERILTAPANLLARFHGLFPGVTINLLGLVNYLLPSAGDGAGTARGMELQGRLPAPLVNTLMGWSLSAARRFNELPGPVHATGERKG